MSVRSCWGVRCLLSALIAILFMSVPLAMELNKGEQE